MSSAPVTTQQAHPVRASLRTVLAVIAGIASITPYVVQILNEGLSGWGAAGIGGQAIIVAGIVTRIMALPGVDRALEHVGLGSSPEVKADEHA